MWNLPRHNKAVGRNDKLWWKAWPKINWCTRFWGVFNTWSEYTRLHPGPISGSLEGRTQSHVCFHIEELLSNCGSTMHNSMHYLHACIFAKWWTLNSSVCRCLLFSPGSNAQVVKTSAFCTYVCVQEHRQTSSLSCTRLFLAVLHDAVSASTRTTMVS